MPSNYKEAYGWEHQKARKAARDAFNEGDVCPLCNKPMYSYQGLDLDHAIPVALGGIDGPTRLAHSSCNSSSGARLGTWLRNQRGESHSKSACLVGEPMARQRDCVICGKHFKAHHRTQLACSRVCGVEVKRRNGAFDRPRKPKVVNSKNCVSCGQPFECRRGGATRCQPCSAELADTALSMRRQGMAWQTIADRLNYSNPGSLYGLATKYGRRPTGIPRYARAELTYAEATVCQRASEGAS